MIATAKRVLVVEPAPHVRHTLVAAIESIAEVDAGEEFERARERLLSSSYDLLVTNLRLHQYNGVNLVHLAQAFGLPTRGIVYDERASGLADEVRRAGALFECTHRLLITLPAYVRGILPSRERRDAATFDRRTHPRGGRRMWDGYLVATL